MVEVEGDIDVFCLVDGDGVQDVAGETGVVEHGVVARCHSSFWDVECASTVGDVVNWHLLEFNRRARAIHPSSNR
ncbi:unannotated protein [freshwater metagenome]|uniref:Unannotated protein n=1 Tax=freshwater metagenome TaxID=449393 RepID=A0A6J6F426_9ZZZZ